MHTHLMSLYKKITAVIILILFSFVLLTPTVNALNYDPKLRKSVIKPNGDGDPWDVPKVAEIEPDNNRFSRILNYSIFGFTSYFYFKFGWDFDILEFSGRQTPSSAPIGSK